MRIIYEIFFCKGSNFAIFLSLGSRRQHSAGATAQSVILLYDTKFHLAAARCQFTRTELMAARRTHSGGARTSRQSGHFQVTKVVSGLAQ